MYVGLIDQDALLEPKHFFPNLEIMKLASYYKKQRDKIEFIFNTNDVDKYSKFYLRKDSLDEKFYDTDLILKKGCEYGGLAFTRGEYAPLSIEVEQCVPDFTIYRNYFKRYGPRIKHGITLKTLENATYLRAIYNDKINTTIVENTINSNSYGRANIYVYDKNFLTLDNLEYINQTMLNNTQKIKFVYSQRTSNFELAKAVCNNNKILSFSSEVYPVIYEKILYNYSFLEIFTESKNFKNPIIIEMGLDKYKTYTNKFFEQEIAKYLNWMIYCAVNKNNKIKFLVSPQVPEGVYRMILSRMQYWHNKNMNSFSFKDYIQMRSKKTISLIEDLSKKNNYLNQLFGISPKKIVDKGGKWYL